MPTEFLSAELDINARQCDVLVIGCRISRWTDGSQRGWFCRLSEELADDGDANQEKNGPHEAARSVSPTRSAVYRTLMTSDSISVFLRYINRRPDSLVCASGTVAVATGTVARLRGATVPNGSPATE
jgi:hypothetical protein